MPPPPDPAAPLRALFVTPELHPLVKTGGLADVSAALPAALRALGVDVRVLLPAYPGVIERLGADRAVLDLPGRAQLPASRLLEAGLACGTPVWVIDCPPLYHRGGGPYQDPAGRDFPDNALRFGLLGWAAALLATDASPLFWRPQVIHCNDWQTGLAPVYLKLVTGGSAKSVMTLHNLAFQGIFPPTAVQELGLPPECFSIHGVEYYGNLSFLKAGIYYADRITAVSPTYAREIQSEPLGFGLHGLLAARRAHLTGILNGIDTQAWDPATDPFIARTYTAATLERKAENKAALQRALGLAPEAGIPLLGVVSRLTHQKGIDLLLAILPRLIKAPAQVAVLGSGEPALEMALLSWSARYPDRIAARTTFDEPLSHLIEAGADAFLMPSRFEPCGLNQMYSQRYGTPPVVRATGGLADTVTDCMPKTLEAGLATGFLFREATAKDFLSAVERALAAYRDPALWRRLQENGMARDFSWRASAERYREIYLSLVNGAQ